MDIKNKLLVILGNGPSLGNIDFDLLRDYNIDTFGLNMAFRKYKELDFVPTYFGCFDYVVCRHNVKEFSQLVYDWPETKFFFVNCDYANQKKQIFSNQVMTRPNFIKINHLYKHQHKHLQNNIAMSFNKFVDGGNTGANSTQVGLIYGYKNIVLIGCDANYIEKVDGAEYIDENGIKRLQIKEKPNVNANYWFNDYQQVGDVYNIPQCKRWHIDEWDRLGKLYKKFYPKADIVNGSPISQINAFSKVDFKKTLHTFLRRIKPNIMASNNYKHGNKVLKDITKLELRNIIINKVKGYDENYSQVNPGRRHYLLKTNPEIKVNKTENINNFSDKFVTFIMPLKDRMFRAKNSIETIVNPKTAKYCNFMIVEDHSANMLNLNYFIYKDYVTHYKVDTGISWTRSGLLNYGIKRATTPLVLFWDADFLYADNFMDKLLKYCNMVDFKKYNFAINLFETHDVPLKERFTFYFGEPYSHIWVHDREILTDIKGFDEEITGHGYEERDLHNRLKLKYNIDTVFSAFNYDDIFACHLSHGDKLRGTLNTVRNRSVSQQKIKRGKTVSNPDIWGEYKSLDAEKL